MSSRHNMALAMFGREQEIATLAGGLIAASHEAEAEGVLPETDAAVLLISYQLSFLTHTDSMPRRMVQDLIHICESNKATPVDPMCIRSH